MSNEQMKEVLKHLPKEIRERTEEAMAKSLERPQEKPVEYVVKNVSTQRRTATQDNRTILAKPDGQLRMTEYEIDKMRKSGNGEFDRNFRIEGKYDPKKHGHIKKD